MWEFVIPASPQGKCVMLNKVMVSANIEVAKREAGSSEYQPVTDDDNVAPCNAIHNTLWDQVTVYIGEQQILTSCDNRPIGVAATRNLTFSSQVKATYLGLENTYPSKDPLDDFHSMAHKLRVKNFTGKEGSRIIPSHHVLGHLTYDLNTVRHPVPLLQPVKFVMRRAPTPLLLFGGRVGWEEGKDGEELDDEQGTPKTNTSGTPNVAEKTTPAAETTETEATQSGTGETGAAAAIGGQQVKNLLSTVTKYGVYGNDATHHF